MPFNKSVFVTRSLSALVFGAIMLFGLFGNDLVFTSIFFIVNILALREYAQLIEKILQTSFTNNEKINLIAIGIFIFVWICSLPITVCTNNLNDFLRPYSFHLLGMTIGSLLVFFLFKKNAKSIYMLTGIGYISLALALLVHLRYQSNLLPMMLIFCIWMNDTMAYISGSFFGKIPFFPSISPKKTWEGIIGGTLFTIALASVWGYLAKEFPMWQWMVFALLASVIGNAGDLIESKLKRLAGVKDSGQMMPGHGGALDRFDSLLFAAPFAYLFALLCMSCLQVHFF